MSTNTHGTNKEAESAAKDTHVRRQDTLIYLPERCYDAMAQFEFILLGPFEPRCRTKSTKVLPIFCMLHNDAYD